MAGRNKQQDNEEEVIDVNAEEENADDKGDEVETDDRGDDAEPEIKLKNLKKIVDGEEEAEGKGDEEEGEEEGEAEGEEDEPEAGGKKGPPKTVPYSRFAEVVKQVKDLEAKVNAKADKPVEGEEEEEAEPFDFDAKEDEYLKAVSEGDFATAKAIRKEINQALKDEVMAEATQEAVQTVGRAESQRQFNAAVDETLKKYPWLNDKGDEADEEAIAEVVEWRNFYITQKKLAPAEALRQAAERVAKGRAKGEEEGEEEEVEGEQSAKTKAEKAALERAREARKKGAEANTKQPPNLKGKGNRETESSQVNIEDMSEEEYDKLPESEKKKHRGD